jgi:hypothetical protein
MGRQQHAQDASNRGTLIARRPPRAVAVLEALEDRRLFAGDVVVQWNELALQSVSSQPPRVPFPRNLALVHVAMFDAVNAIERAYVAYAVDDIKASHGASAEAAAAQAARDTLVALYPSRQAIYDAALAEDLADIPSGLAKQGVAVGQEAARQILALRANDGASAVVNYVPPNQDPGQWQPTPPDGSANNNAHVPLITPFAVESNSQFRPGPPPELTSEEYATAFNEVKSLGSATSTARTADQTQVAMVWRVAANNVTVWNRIAQGMADDGNTNLVENARLFALMNMSLNDGLQTSNESKFHYALWRPITAIRRAGEDGNPATEADPTWNTLHPTTPPYPTYAGNAATIGAACATVLGDVFGDDVPFQVDWSPYGFAGVTRSYDDFWDAADEMAVSRVYGGIHFSFDSDAGQQVGADVAGYVMERFLLPQDTPGAAPAGAAARPASIVADTNAGFADAADDEDRLAYLTDLGAA